MYERMLNFFGYETYKILDMDLVHKYGATFKNCSVYIGTKENWDSTRELVYRRGQFNPDHTRPVATLETPMLKVMRYGKVATSSEAYYTGTRKRRK